MFLRCIYKQLPNTGHADIPINFCVFPGNNQARLQVIMQLWQQVSANPVNLSINSTTIVPSENGDIIFSMPLPGSDICIEKLTTHVVYNICLILPGGGNQICNQSTAFIDIRDLALGNCMLTTEAITTESGFSSHTDESESLRWVWCKQIKLTFSTVTGLQLSVLLYISVAVGVTLVIPSIVCMTAIVLYKKKGRCKVRAQFTQIS